MANACREFDLMIARRASLTAEETAKLDAHLATCGACRDLARMMKPVDSTVFQTLADDPPSDERSFENARYRITGEVGRGGIGRVLEALDQVLDRPVALKELFSENAALRRRFVREAMITARLQHPSIVPIYDAGHLGDRSPFYAMKLVAGQTLHHSIDEANTLAERLALLPRVLAVADAMAYAHSKRIIHRDLKPANILVGAFGETIVIDWGLAKDLAVDDEDAPDPGPYRSTATAQTTAGVVMGTPAFMAPEQAASGPIDERADVYALGAILYSVVAGIAPHEGATFEELLKRVITGDVKPIAEREPEIPRDLAAIIGKAMALAPADRYPDAGGIADELRRFLTGQLVTSHTYRARELVQRWVKRHRTAVSVALAAIVVLAVVGVTSVVRIVNARDEAREQRAIAVKEVANLLEEQGRQELVAGRPTRAVAYLGEAYTQVETPGVALRTLLADAMRSVETEQLSIEGRRVAFNSDGTRIVAVGKDYVARVHDTATGKLIATLTVPRDLAVDREEVELAAFSPDNARIVTAGSGPVRFWDARNGKLLATLLGSATVAAFSPDGASVVTGGEGGFATLWDGKTSARIGSLEGHSKDVESVAFSPDGTRIVTASADRTAKIWDARTAKLLSSLDGHGDVVTSAAFSPDGSQIVTASSDQTARVWSARTGELLLALKGHGAEVRGAAFSPDGTRIVTASGDRSAKLWDSRTGTLVGSLDGHTAAVISAAFSSDGTRVVTASDDRTAKLWDVRTARSIASFEGHRDDLTSASFRPDGRQVLTASEDGTAKLWNAASTSTRISIDAERGVLSPDGTKLATTNAKLWDVATGKPLASFAHVGAVSHIAFDATGTRIATASADHTAKLWDTSGKLLLSIDHPDAVTSVGFSADGARVITSTCQQCRWVWNAATGALIGHFEKSGLEYPIGFSPDGTRVLIVTAMSATRVVDVDTRAVLVELADSKSPIYAATFSADGERVAAASIDRSMKVWNARTGAVISSLEGTTTNQFGGWFSPDGARLVTASASSTAKLWDVATGKLLASYDGHTADVVIVRFEGERVLTVSADRTAKLWDERTGRLLASFDHGATSVDGTLTRDRVIIATDGAVTSWDVHLEQRPPAEIRRLVDARSPWTLSNGVLVPDSRRGNR